MFKVGDLVIYATHGICEIDDISEKTMADVTQDYYELHPLDDPSLKISMPVDRAKTVMQRIIKEKEARQLAKLFKQPAMRWIENNNQRANSFNAIIRKGDREEIAKVANTLLRRKRLLEMNDKKLSNRDTNILNTIQNNLFNEMAISLDMSYEAVEQKLKHTILENLV